MGRSAPGAGFAFVAGARSIEVTAHAGSRAFHSATNRPRSRSVSNCSVSVARRRSAVPASERRAVDSGESPARLDWLSPAADRTLETRVASEGVGATLVSAEPSCDAASFARSSSSRPTPATMASARACSRRRAAPDPAARTNSGTIAIVAMTASASASRWVPKPLDCLPVMLSGPLSVRPPLLVQSPARRGRVRWRGVWRSPPALAGAP